jgi:glycosyltransferase involved in cell wall biosynthesis
LHSYAQVANKHPDVILCVVEAAFDAAERADIRDMGLGQRVVHYGYVADQQLARLYRQCIAFVYPSLYEGFGIPPLICIAARRLSLVIHRASLE